MVEGIRKYNRANEIFFRWQHKSETLCIYIYSFQVAAQVCPQWRGGLWEWGVVSFRLAGWTRDLKLGQVPFIS